MKQIKFWLLDINYDISKDGIPEIRMWGIDDNGNRVVVIDRTFRPYFYAVPEKGVETQSVVSKIKKLEPKYKILNVEVVSKKFYGKPIDVIKITCQIPTIVPNLREAVKKLPGIKDVLEADIRFYMRYMIDKDVYPSTWHIADVEEIEVPEKWRIDKVYVLKGDLRRSDETTVPPLRVLAFDIECYNKFGTPKPERDPVIVISVMTNNGDKKVFTADGKNDASAIKGFTEFLNKYDPDVIVGYNCNGFDWPYLLERCKALKLKLSVARSGAQPATSVYGHISIIGRANVDLYDFAEDIYEVKVKTLENIAEYLGVKKKNERILIPGIDIYKYWDDPAKRETLIRYAIDDVESILGLADKFLPFAIQLSSIVGLPLDQVGSASVGYRVEWHLMRQAYKFNELVPNRVERPYRPYKGAIVLKPKPGLHENIAVLDFSSLYPNIMISKNISPDTYVPPYEKVDPSKVNIAPEVGHRFLKEPPGFYKKVLERLLKFRKMIKEQMKKLDPTSIEYTILYERQRAIKVIANATYGYCGWVGARWYKREVAEATTAWGRKTIRETIELAKKMGLRVIYGDTDSIFIKYDKDKVKRFIEEVNKKLGLEIKPDKIYIRVFFTEAKKRYCGLLSDGRIDVVGLEAIRGDWTELAKEVQEEIIKIVLTKKDPAPAVKYVHEVIEKLRGKEIPMDKLIIWKSITKKLSEYEVSAAHVVAARKLLAAGYSLTVGDKIGYVIVKRPGGRLADKAEPYVFVKDMDELDIDYYIKKQIIPVAIRILGYFGISENQLLAGRRQASLFDFFG